MAGRTSRDRGKRGENEAEAVLIERGYEVLDTTDGKAICDFVATRHRKRYAVEVKHQKGINLEKFTAQAREQGKALRMPWLLMIRLPGHPYQFLVVASDIPPTVWRGNASKRGGS